MIETTQYASKSKTTYPKLMKHMSSGSVVLFTKDRHGMVISSSPRHFIGEYSTVWDMSKFTEYGGSITLENK